MISIHPCDRTCAACGVKTRVGTDRRHKLPTWTPDAAGVDGRPGYDPGFLTHDHYIEECTACGHLAPNVSVPYPHLEASKVERPKLFGLTNHAPAALRCLAAANLLGDTDRREEGFWVLCAAWLDEAAGNAEAARSLRLRAGSCLEDAVYQGVALSPVRGATALLLAETFRLAGAYGRAFEHALRGLRFNRHVSQRERPMLIFELDCIVARRTQPLTCADALRGFETVSPERSKELVQLLTDAAPGVDQIRLRPWRRSAHPSWWSSSLYEEASAFAHDYMDQDLMIDLLRDGRIGVWSAVCARNHYLPALLRATDHEDPQVRKHALAALFEQNLSFAHEALAGHEDAVDAFARRLGDTDESAVRYSGAIAKQLISHAKTLASRIIPRAREALPRWTADLSTTGVLERLIDAAPPTNGPDTT